MDLDTIITLFIILVFFILPNLAKMFINKAKNTPEKKKTSDKIRDKITSFLMGIEQQVQSPSTLSDPETEKSWEQHLNENAEYDEDDYYEESEPTYSRNKLHAEEFWERDSALKEQTEIIVDAPFEPKTGRTKPQTTTPASATMPSTPYMFRSAPLQNAVIWAEILGKPMSLRKKGH